MFGNQWNESVFLITKGKPQDLLILGQKSVLLLLLKFFFNILLNLGLSARRKGEVAPVNRAWRCQSSSKFCLNRKVSPAESEQS